MVPELDKRMREDVLEQIRALADSYTPEWRFNRTQPDLGSALALLYAEMMEETIACYNGMLERNRAAFFNALGAEQREAQKAEGVMTFGLTKPDMPEAVVPEGIGIAADGGREGPIAFELLEDVYVSSNDGMVNAGRVRAQNPGPEGNIPAGSDLRLLETVGYVSRIGNPEGMHGGRPKETVEQAIDRSSAQIRHQSYAVTPGDFECLVRELCPDAVCVKCFSGYDGDGRRCPGAVTVVILQEESVSFLRERIKSGVLQKNRLFFVKPVFIRVQVRAELCVKSLDQVLKVQREAEEGLIQFLDSVEGGYHGTGWEFGAFPEYEQVKRRLQHLPQVVYVRQLWMIYEQDGRDGFRELDEERVKNMPWALPFSGSHQVAAVVG